MCSRAAHRLAGPPRSNILAVLSANHTIMQYIRYTPGTTGWLGGKGRFCATTVLLGGGPDSAVPGNLVPLFMHVRKSHPDLLGRLGRIPACAVCRASTECNPFMHAALVTCLAVDPAGLLRHISAAVGPKTAGRSAEHGDDSRSGGRRPPLAKRILHACRGGA